MASCVFLCYRPGLSLDVDWTLYPLHSLMIGILDRKCNKSKKIGHVGDKPSYCMFYCLKLGSVPSLYSLTPLHNKHAAIKSVDGYMPRLKESPGIGPSSHILCAGIVVVFGKHYLGQPLSPPTSQELAYRRNTQLPRSRHHWDLLESKRCPRSEAQQLYTAPSANILHMGSGRTVVTLVRKSFGNVLVVVDADFGALVVPAHERVFE